MFKIHQVVEAYHNGGWWEGVVWKAPRRRNGAYTVCFPSSREVFELKVEEMREQLEWVKGAWVPVQHQEGDAIFRVGSQVEVSRDEKNYGAAWFVGTVLKVIGKSYFLVMYKNLRIDGGGSRMLLKEIVDREYIRPCPPSPSEFDSFNVLDEVEAFHKDGWLVGVVAGVLPGSRYIVKSKHHEEEFELDQNLLRPHFIWSNEHWVHFSQEKGSRALVSRGNKSACRKQKSCAVERDEVPLLLTSCDSNGELAGENVVTLKVNKSEGHRAEGGVETSQPSKKLKKVKLLQQLEWAPTDPSLSNTENTVSVIEAAPSDPIPIASSPPDKDICDNDELIPSTCPTKKAVIEIDPAPTESLHNKIALPFPKMSAMWRIVESMEAFHSIPQQPHFRELNKYLQDFREGMAIGLMLTFANIVDDIRKLRITDSHDIIDRNAALESNGFNVQVVRSHLEKLLVIQSNASQSAAKQSFLEGEILERENEVHQFDEAITEHDKVVSKLEEYFCRCHERRTSLLLEKNSKESEVLQLKRDLKATTETYYSAEMHFNATTNVPW